MVAPKVCGPKTSPPGTGSDPEELALAVLSALLLHRDTQPLEASLDAMLGYVAMQSPARATWARGR